MSEKRYRVAIIGATGQGGYGHGLDTAFQGLKQADVCALADSDPAGREQAGKRLGITAVFADYRQMLSETKPEIAVIGPTWLTDRVAMIRAAAEQGCHLYCEKPLCFSTQEANEISALCRRYKVKLAMAHQWRAMPPVQKALAEIRAGKYGRVLRMRARPKDDARGGGEELLIHGTHWFDLMFAIAGRPRWVSGYVQMRDRPVRTEDVRVGSMPVGPIWGDSLLAAFGFDQGVLGTFDSTANTAPTKDRPADPAWDSVYGLTVECEQATLQWRQPGDVFVYPAPGVLPDLEALTWNRIWIEDWHFTETHLPRNLRQEWLAYGNRVLAKDLIEAIELDRDPLSPVQHGAWVAEMVQGTYASHFVEGRRLAIPLADRRHPGVKSDG